MKTYQEENIDAIERWIEGGWKWGTPLTKEECDAIRKGAFPLCLTPNRLTPESWFEGIKGKKILGLAAGGGQQGPLLAIKGADVTTFDYSKKQLESDKIVARRENLSLKTIQGDFTKPLPFLSNTFDIVINPVSFVYAENIAPIFKEISRVTKAGGLLIGGYDNGINFITDENEEKITQSLPFNPLKNPEQKAFLLQSDAGYEFSHTTEETLKAILDAGFEILDLYEDTNDEGNLKNLSIPTFFAVKARKR